MADQAESSDWRSDPWELGFIKERMEAEEREELGEKDLGKVSQVVHTGDLLLKVVV